MCTSSVDAQRPRVCRHRPPTSFAWDWPAAEARARRLLDRLGGSRTLYLRFYRADTRTGNKSREPLEWFEQLAGISDQD